MKLHEIGKGKSVDEAVSLRREYLEKEADTSLEHVGKYSIDMEAAFKSNIENPIGTVQVPLGVAGPLRVNDEEYFVPLATSEGALVASVNRGCSAITSSGGCNAKILNDQMTRAPVIKVDSVDKALELKDWFRDNFSELKSIAESTTSHGKLVKIDPVIVNGPYVYPRFVYTTGDSMGMNMVTIATDKVLDYMVECTNASVIALSGNVCVDKKPSQLNNILGRGKSVSADIVIPEDIVESKLKTTAEGVVEVNLAKNLMGSVSSGTMAYNAHFANIVAALFLATGQDIAHTVEGSLGTTYAESRDGDLYFSVSLPDLPVATVGGGTRLETASEGLNLLGCKGSGNVDAFACVVAGSVLAGELSLLSALSAGHLARAHSTLGR